MRTSTPTRREDVRDPIGITGWPQEKGRDGERTPMQWTPGPQAGFSANPRTWLPVAPNYKTFNVATQRKDRGSLLNWWHALVRLRKAEPALRNGGMEMLDKGNPDVLSFRRGGDQPGSVAVAVNMSAHEASVDLGRSSFSTLAETDAVARPEGLSGRLRLPPYASWIGKSR
jgi:alpha-glucosidase